MICCWNDRKLEAYATWGKHLVAMAGINSDLDPDLRLGGEELDAFFGACLFGLT